MINSTTNTFGYNSKSELIDAAMGLDDYGYNYDQIGNRIKALSTVDSVTSEFDYLSNALNQYTNISYGQGSSLPSYDADGNMLTNGDWTYTYNGENRLTTASNATTVVNFKYDYMGRRFEKSVEGGSTNTFIYDGWNPVMEVRSENGEVGNVETNYYSWGLDLSGSLQGAGGIGGLLSTVQDGDIYFSCFDANGNITDYVDETGDIVAHYEYNPFGGITSATGNKKDDFNFRFSTKYLDTETDLYYYGYRYYSAELGRWINRDPIDEEGGLMLYGFCVNSPLDKYDRLGLSGTDLEASPDCVCKDGSKKGLRPRPHFVLECDGCTLSPDQFVYLSHFGKLHTINFYDACQAHDYCYQKCGADRKDCDLGLRDALRGSCKAYAREHPIAVALDPRILIACYATAEAYYRVVRVTGNMDSWWGFDNFQEAACEECCCK
jgi:RHS repeat-associated protein